MRTTNKFVAVHADGTYLTVSVSNSHVGEKVTFGKVTSIDDATTFYNANAQGYLSHQHRDQFNRLKVTWCPVTVHLEVVLQAFGVKDGI